MFPLAFVAGWLQGHWWGFVSRNYVVWPTFLLMNVFIALKGSHFWFLFVWFCFIWVKKLMKLTHHCLNLVAVICFRGHVSTLNCICMAIISARPRSAEYTLGIFFETAKNTKAFECFFTGFQHSLWKFSTTGNLYSLKAWLWLAAVVCVVSWPISNVFLNDIWLICFTRMCNWTTDTNTVYCGYIVGWPASSNG